jgi:hypothetical protein
MLNAIVVQNRAHDRSFPRPQINPRDEIARLDVQMPVEAGMESEVPKPGFPAWHRSVKETTENLREPPEPECRKRSV